MSSVSFLTCVGLLFRFSAEFLWFSWIIKGDDMINKIKSGESRKDLLVLFQKTNGAPFSSNIPVSISLQSNPLSRTGWVVSPGCCTWKVGSALLALSNGLLGFYAHGQGELLKGICRKASIYIWMEGIYIYICMWKWYMYIDIYIIYNVQYIYILYIFFFTIYHMLSFIYFLYNI